MADVKLEITKPAAGAEVTRKITVSGTAALITVPQWPTVKPEKLTVRFGSGGEAKELSWPVGSSWSVSGAPSPTAVGGRPLQIT